MKRVLFGLLAATALASNTGCCCLDRLFCWGCSPCGGGCGSCWDSGPCDSCGSSGGGHCDSCGGGGYSGGPSGYGPEAGMAQYGGGNGGNGGGNGAPGMARRKPAQGHPLVQQRRDAGGEYEFAAGPPSGGVTYPYYTNRGPRDYLARNPRSIGP